MKQETKLETKKLIDMITDITTAWTPAIQKKKIHAVHKHI